MFQISLPSDKLLKITKEGYRIQLTIIENDQVIGCRKESQRKLTGFFDNHENRLFKGRIQLHKVGNKIGVDFKGKLLGTVPILALKLGIENLS